MLAEFFKTVYLKTSKYDLDRFSKIQSHKWKNCVKFQVNSSLSSLQLIEVRKLNVLFCHTKKKLISFEEMILGLAQLMIRDVAIMPA